jgi:hypothetical protein
MQTKKNPVKIAVTIVLLMLSPIIHASDIEKENVRRVIQSAYVEGFQNLGGRQMMEAGFHPTFIMVLNRAGVLSDLPLERMIEIVEQRLSNPDYKHITVQANILDIDITGNAAMVKMELFREGKKLFTDYLGLYKFEDGWMIFNKLYHQH